MGQKSSVAEDVEDSVEVGGKCFFTDLLHMQRLSNCWFGQSRASSLLSFLKFEEEIFRNNSKLFKEEFHHLF